MGVILIFVLLNLSIAVVYIHGGMAIDPIYDIGDNYEIWGWNPGGGYLIFWESRENEEWKKIIESPEYITSFAIKEPWVWGKTNKNWFLLNKQDNKFYSNLTEEDIKKHIDFDFKNIALITDPSPYAPNYEWVMKTTKKVKIISVILLIVFPLFLGYLPYIWRKIFKKQIVL